MQMNDTIAAISTPLGSGGIGILRISGEKAFEIAARLFQGKKSFEKIRTHTINYGKIVDPENGDMIDEVLLTRMNKPNTFTKEDVVEINCHGGIVVLLRILKLIVKEGARPAEAGEFTKRAFLNGRIDLSQAEAIVDIINARTAEASKAAVDQLEGRLSESVGEARRKLIGLLADIEVTIDFPEHDTEEETSRNINQEVALLAAKLKNIAGSFDKGRVIREGINVVIAGKPNAGKSSLLNELAGKNRAIVTDIPGTTRDIIEEYISIKGIPVNIIDTAGIRSTEDPIEKIGVEKAEKAINSADLIIMVLDACAGMQKEDYLIMEKIVGKKAIYLINKIDAASEKEITLIENNLSTQKVIRVAVINGMGISELETEIERLFLKGGLNANGEVLVTNIRHKSLLDRAIESLDSAHAACESNTPLDFITIDLRNAADCLGQITGETVSEDVLKEIFSRFCIGK